jgi:hypothetical protein
MTVPNFDDRKLRHNIKSRQSKRINPSLSDDQSLQTSSPLPCRNPSTSNSNESKLIPCSELQCHKQFTSSIALSFHLNDAHRTVNDEQTPQTSSSSSSSSTRPNSRDEEDVAHILVNVADYVRRASPEHQQRPATLSWPCPQISSNRVLSSSLNNTEATERNAHVEHDDIKSNVKPADHFLLHIQDGALAKSSAWTDTKSDRTNLKKSLKGAMPSPPPPPPPPPSASSSFVPIDASETGNVQSQPLPEQVQTSTSTLPLPLSSSSPAYSDISDEDSTCRLDNEQVPPSTVNLLTGNNQQGIYDEHEPTLPSRTRWTTQMLLQQYGSYMQQPHQTISSNQEQASNR